MGRAQPMTPKDYAALLIEVGAVEIRTDPERWFTWVSGERAPIYCDNRLLISFPRARVAIADGLAAAIRRRFPDVEWIAGTATAGIPYAAWVAERLDCPMVYVRAGAKDHGRKRRVEGRQPNDVRVVLVEDLISFGGSSRAAVHALREEGGKVIGVQAILSYGFADAARGFEKIGVSWQALTNFDALLSCLEIDEATRQVLLGWLAR